MAFDWREFLLLARELEDEASECRQRTAIGRAYYYVYNVGFPEAKRRGYRGGGSHKKLWRWCMEHQNPELAELGDRGNTLYARRLDADYVAESKPSLRNDVRKQLDKALEFEKLLKLIPTEAIPPGPIQ